MDDITDDQIELLLRQQVHRLDLAFRDFIAIDLGRHQHQVNMNAALRAQAQCRATASTLKQWKMLSAGKNVPAKE